MRLLGSAGTQAYPAANVAPEKDAKGKTAFETHASAAGHRPVRIHRSLSRRNKVTLSADRDPREVFADWLITPRNRWFTRSIVNRVWYWLIGRGIIHEPDDIRDDNLPSNPDLLRPGKRNDRRALRSEAPLPADPHLRAPISFPRFPAQRRVRPTPISPFTRKTDGRRGLDRRDQPDHRHHRPLHEPHPGAVHLHSGGRVRGGVADGSISSPFLALFGRPARATGMENERDHKRQPAIESVQYAPAPSPPSAPRDRSVSRSDPHPLSAAAPAPSRPTVPAELPNRSPPDSEEETSLRAQLSALTRAQLQRLCSEPRTPFRIFNLVRQRLSKMRDTSPVSIRELLASPSSLEISPLPRVRRLEPGEIATSHPLHWREPANRQSVHAPASSPEALPAAHEPAPVQSTQPPPLPQQATLPLLPLVPLAGALPIPPASTPATPPIPIPSLSSSAIASMCSKLVHPLRTTIFLLTTLLHILQLQSRAHFQATRSMHHSSVQTR